MSARLTLIAAVAKNGVIGANGALPWRISSDMKHFKAATLGKPVLMGRKTWDSLPRKPLPGRPNLVLSRDADFRPDGAWAYSKLDAFVAAGAAMAEKTSANEMCVIGGGLLYAETIGFADRLILTEVNLAPEGDAKFPRLDPNLWAEVSREALPRGENDDADCTIRTFHRKR